MWYSTVSTSAAGKTQGCEGIGPTHHHHPFQHASEASPGFGLKIFKVIKPRLEKIEWGLGSKLEVPPGHGRDDGDLANQHILLRLIHWFFFISTVFTVRLLRAAVDHLPTQSESYARVWYIPIYIIYIQWFNTWTLSWKRLEVLDLGSLNSSTFGRGMARPRKNPKIFQGMKREKQTQNTKVVDLRIYIDC